MATKIELALELKGITYDAYSAYQSLINGGLLSAVDSAANLTTAVASTLALAGAGGLGRDVVAFKANEIKLTLGMTELLTQINNYNNGRGDGVKFGQALLTVTSATAGLIGAIPGIPLNIKFSANAVALAADAVKEGLPILSSLQDDLTVELAAAGGSDWPSNPLDSGADAMLRAAEDAKSVAHAVETIQKYNALHPEANASIPSDALIRNSTDYLTNNSAHSVQINLGGKAWDAFAVQRSEPYGFTDWVEFQKAAAACNPSVINLADIPAGTTLYLPQKIADGSITYNYASGASINTKPANGDYYMTVPNGSGNGTTIYSRQADPNGLGGEGYTVKVTQVGADNAITSETTARQATLDGPLTNISTTEILPGAASVTSIDSNADGIIDNVTLDWLGANSTVAGPEIDLRTNTTSTTTPTATATVDQLAKYLENTRTSFAWEDELLVNAQEIRWVTGAQDTGETWGGGRMLAISESPLGDWYMCTKADYADQAASGTVQNSTSTDGANGFATSDANGTTNADTNVDVYNGLGFLAGWNKGDTTSFASYGSSGDLNTPNLAAPTFDYYINAPQYFDLTLPPDIVVDPFTYVAPPYVPDYTWLEPTYYDPYDWFTPVVLDLDGDGIELIDQQDSHAYFDVKGDGSGNRYNVGWVGADDAMLAIDKNNDGKINQADELSFAMWTANPNDTDMDGLKAVFDTNLNGILDSGDARFADMRIWQDNNGDGVSDAGELKTLSEAKIASLNLSPARTNWSQGGNLVNGFSTYTRTNGTLGWAGDVAMGYEAAGWQATTLTNFVKVSQSGGLTYGLANTNTAMSLDLGVQGLDGVAGGNANDVLSAGARNAVMMEGGLGNDTLTGGSGDDWLNGGAGADSLTGGAGDDTVVFDSADTYVNGGAGIDIAMVSGGTGATLDLGATAFEAAVGSDGSDIFFTTGTGRIILAGEGGDDKLAGGINSDMLDGGKGNDSLAGGAGNDVYVFGRGDGADTIRDEADTTTKTPVTTTQTILKSINDPYGNSTYAYPWNAEIQVSRNWTLGELYFNSQYYYLRNNPNRSTGWGATWTGNNGTLQGNYYGTTSYYVDQTTTRIQSVTVSINAGSDTLQLGAGIACSDLDAELFGADLTLGLRSQNAIGAAVSALSDRITISNQTNALSSIETIRFSDGSTESLANWRYGTAGADNLIGDAQVNHLFAGAGNDTLDGGVGLDIMVGGLGDDSYVVDNLGDQVVESLSSGTDSVQSSVNYTLGSNLENLTLTGTAAVSATGNALNNILTGNAANNVLDGAAGSDSMAGGAGDDLYIVDSSTDTVVEAVNQGIDTVQASTSFSLGSNVENLVLTGAGEINAVGNDLANTITGNASGNLIDGGLGADLMTGGAGNDGYQVDDIGDSVVELAGGGVDWVYSDIADYTLTANVERLFLRSGGINGTGNDADNRLTGNVHNNTLTGGAGNDRLDGGGGLDTLVGGLGDDTYMVATSTDVIVEVAGQGIDTIEASVSFDMASAANVENANFIGAAGGNLTGNALNNSLQGNDGANILNGAGGNDTLSGNAGNDTYLFGLGGGVDTVYDTDATVGNADTLRLLSGVSSANVTLGRGNNNQDLEVLINGTNDKIVIADWFADTSTRVETISFADEATVWDVNYIMQHAAILGTSGSDYLTGDEGNNTFDGLAGDDVLIGGTGNDTYQFGVGSGQDTILDQDATANNTDTLRITGGVPPTGVSLSRDATDLFVKINMTGETAVLKDWFVDTSSRVERIEFAGNSTVWDASYIFNAVSVGSAGDDLMYGTAGADVLDGGAGADSMSGGAGDDAYIVDNVGDLIVEGSNEGIDLVRSSVGFILGANLETLELTGADAISANGNELNNRLIGNDAGNNINGGAGADFMDGGLGNDYYTVDDVGDVVQEAAGAGYDTVSSSINWTLGANFEDLVLFGTATSATGNELDNWIYGNSLNNTLVGGAGNDILKAAAGADTMLGGSGNDTYYFDQTGDMAIELANEGTDKIISTASVNLTGMANVEKVSLTGMASLSVIGNDQDNNIQGNGGNSQLSGGAGNDTLGAGSGADTLNGGVGNDSLYGGLGADTYVFERNGGRDTIFEVSDAGIIDTLQLGAGIAPSDVLLSRSSDHLILSIIGTTDQITVLNWFSGIDSQVERIVFANGTVWDTTVMQAAQILGTAADDNLFGTVGNDAFDGLGGNDQLSGDEGDDSYWFGRGSGQDVVYDYSATPNVDRLCIKPGLLPSDLVLSRDYSDLIVSIKGTSDQVRLTSWFTNPNCQVEQVVFDNGVIWENSVLQAAVFRGTDGVDSLAGDGSGNTFDSGAGDDVMSGSGGSDVYIFGRGYGSDMVSENEAGLPAGSIDTLRLLPDVAPGDVTLSRNFDDLFLSINGTSDQIRLYGWFRDPAFQIERIEFANGTVWDTAYLQATNLYLGTATDDAFIGSEGADVFNGGLGDDLLLGQSGNDTYIFGRGLGHDTVIEGDLTVGNVDSIQFLAGVDPGDVSVVRDGNNLVLSIANSQDQLTVPNWFYETASRVEQILFANGVIWDTASFAQLPLVGDAGNNVLTGGVESDALMAGAGDDILIGDSGDDLLMGEAGADQMYGNLGNDYYSVDNVADTVIEYVGEGYDTVETTVSYTLSSDIENLILSGTSSISGIGNELDNMLTGNVAGNVLSGGAGSDVLDGNAGADTLLGGGGDDTYFVDASGDSVSENLSEGTDTVNASVSYTLTANVENLSLTGANPINGTGNSLANILLGNDNANVLDGGSGVDTLFGGLGDDTYVVDNVADVVFEGVAEGTDTVNASVTFVLTADVENLNLTGTAAINGTGNALNNVLGGNSAANILSGGAGDDQYRFGQGSGADRVVEATGNDRIVFGAGISSGQVTASRSAGVVTLKVSATDSISFDDLGGGTYALEQFEFANGTVLNSSWIDGLLSNAAPTATNLSAAETFTEDSVRNLVDMVVSDTDSTSTAVTLTLSNVAAGRFSTGTSGAVTSSYNAATGQWQASGAIADVNALLSALTFTPTANFNGSFSVATSVSDGTAATITGSKSFTVTPVNDAPTGSVVISGTATQGQTLTASNSLVDVDGLGAISFQWKAGGVAIVGATASSLLLDATLVGKAISVTASYTDAQGTAESVTSAATVAVVGASTGITGTAGADTLSGTTGGDQMQGLAGNDTYVVNHVGDVVVEALNAGSDLVQSSINYTLTDNVENLTLTGTTAVNGMGNTLANTLTGNTGANILDGGAGVDTMVGGTGNDTYYVDNTGDITTEAASAGTDTVISSVTRTLGANLENLTLSGTASINATGNTLANVLTGNAGDNLLDGGTGKDTLVGGAGNDTYVVDVATDIVTEALNAGTDTVQSKVTLTLGANLENLTLTGTSKINGTGNALDNVLTGNSAANVLTGGAGNDTYVVGTGDTTIEVASAGTDTVQSSIAWTLANNVENLTLTGTAKINGTGNTLDNVLLGNTGVNTLTGNAGNDTLNGGAGADILVGGAGNDTYWLGRGYGADTITENDATAGNTDVARFDVGISMDQLWFTHTGNNLDVSIIGTSDKFTLTNWYLGNQYHVEQFKTSDGKTLLDSQVQSLVDAMAGFAPPAAGQTTLAANYASVLSPVIAANWQ